jgi:hypothetical protein
MHRVYIEPEQMNALSDIFHEAKRLLGRQGVTDQGHLDTVARRILILAYADMPPWLILAEIMPPITPEDAGLPRGGERIDLARL